ncbi:MAG TPA: hypothetical protein VKA67_00375 [Verrucomicrobiae bacterium]|nr:hypothetical protein [Verrucomicrobiae bacterium]
MHANMLVCFALKEEAVPFRKIAAGKSGISVLLTGIGRKNAEKSVRDFLASNSGGASVLASRTREPTGSQKPFVIGLAPPDLVLTCGFAGGLNPELQSGDVVFEIPSCSSRGNEAQKQIGDQSEPPHVGCYKKLIATGAKPAKFFCADRIATTAVEKKKLRDETGADAVEMESEAIHAICREREIPCATVRVISDTADEDLPLDFNKLAKPDLNLDYGKLLAAVARSPGKIPALLRLQKQTRAAAENLSAVLAKVIEK